MYDSSAGVLRLGETRLVLGLEEVSGSRGTDGGASTIFRWGS